MKKVNKHSIISNSFYLMNKTYKICPARVYFDIMSQVFSKGKMYIFNIFYPLYIYQAIQENKNFSVIIRYIFFSLLIILVFDAFNNYYNSYKKPIFDMEILKKVNEDIFNKRTNLDINTYENQEFYEKLNQTVHNVSNNFLETQNSFLSCIFDAMYLMLTIGLMVNIDLKIGCFVLIPVVVSFGLGAKLNKNQYDLNMDLLSEDRKLNYVKNTFFLKDYSKEIKLTKIIKPLINFLNSAYDNSISHIHKKGFKIGLKTGLMEILGKYIVNIGALIYISYQVMVSKRINIGEFYFLLFSIITLSWYLTSTVSNVLKIGENGLYINQYREFCDMETNIETSTGLEVKDIDNVCIEFKNVFFRYHNEELYTLEGINLKFYNKEKVALVGYNGAGKTTIIKLMLRLYDVTKGEILLNGHNIKEYDIKSYRNIFGTVFQDFQAYANKLSTNISMEEGSNDYAKVAEAAKKSGIDKKIEGLDNKYDTVYSKEFDDDGVVFSGGEIQKVAIARAFYNTKKISIFDEPSSFLDPYAEKQIFKKMLNNSNNQTTIFVSHRLSAAVLADKIYYIEDGKVLEEGVHANLIESKGKYYEVFHAQACNYQ